MKKTKQDVETTFKLTVRLPRRLADEVKIRAVREGKSLQDITAAALQEYLRKPLSKEGER